MPEIIPRSVRLGDDTVCIDVMGEEDTLPADRVDWSCAVLINMLPDDVLMSLRQGLFSVFLMLEL